MKYKLHTREIYKHLRGWLFISFEHSRHSLRSSRVFRYYENARAQPCRDEQFYQARNQDFIWGGANLANVDHTSEMYFLFNSF